MGGEEPDDIASDDDLPRKNLGKVVKNTGDGGLKVFVGGLPWAATEEQLRKHFAKHGEIEEISLPAKNAYITFKRPDGVSGALRSNGSKFGEHVLKVNQKITGGAGKPPKLSKDAEEKEKVDWRRKKKKGVFKKKKKKKKKKK